MRWTRTTEWGNTIFTDEGTMDPRDVDLLINANRACNDGADHTAAVSATAQRSAEYGEVKCSVTVTLHCPQTGAWLDYTAKTAFKAALEYCNDGFGWMRPGAQGIEGPQ